MPTLFQVSRILILYWSDIGFGSALDFFLWIVFLGIILAIRLVRMHAMAALNCPIGPSDVLLFGFIEILMYGFVFYDGL